MKCMAIRLILMAFAVLAWPAVSAGGKDKAPAGEPDYTKGEKPFRTDVPWALGATGAFGDIWYGDPRQIHVASVTKGSPADGKLRACDVILGVQSPRVAPGPHDRVDEKCSRCGASGKAGTCGHFTWEARKTLSAAITEAEKTGGNLVLTVWRPTTKTFMWKNPKFRKAKPEEKREVVKPIEAKTISVTVSLPKKGTFSASSPWECEKTKALIEDAAQAIVKKGLSGGITDDLNALGLLSTGEAKYLPIVREYARKKAKDCEALDIMGDKGTSSWSGGYLNTFLTEYYLLTKDLQVLPGIKALSTYLAYGQSGVGTWSHGMAAVKENGLYGPPGAYGAMNQCSLTCALSLALAQKCGIRTNPVNDAVNRSRRFYLYYVDKGTIPYGDHAPALKHDSNGRNSQAAVFFDLLGEKAATKFFTRMTLASYTIREAGHTGHFFAWQWGALGASRGGQAAAQSFVKNTRWFTELERRTDGSSVYQYQLKNDHHKYANWNTTGQRLMQHCLPRKVLYITGKEASCIAPFTAAEVKDAVDAATFNPKGLSVEELLAKLGNWSLVVRRAAAEELGTREDDVVERLIAMLDSPNRFARYGAATALCYAGRESAEAVDKLVDKIENDKDMTLRFFAVNALALPRGKSDLNILGSASRKAAPALLKLAASCDLEQDATRKLSGEIANLMLYGGHVQDLRGFYPNGQGTETVDRKLLIPAMKSWLTNPNGGVRSNASSVYQHMSPEDLDAIWAEIYCGAKYPAPSGVMFGNGVRANGALVLAKYRFREGLPLGLDYLYQEGWGKFARVPAAFNALAGYGSALKPYLNEMKTREYDRYVKGRKAGEVRRCKEAWQKIMDNIDKDIELRSIQPFLEGADTKPPPKVFPPKG